MTRIGVFGGSFNPIHNGHVAIAAAARDSLRLDKVIFVVANTQPFKDPKELAPFEHRLEMTKLAVSEEKSFEASDIEGARGGVSYTIDTLREFKKIYGADSELFLIVGSDSLTDIPKWRNPKEIVKIAAIIVYPRRGDKNFSPREFQKLFGDDPDEKVGLRFLLGDYQDASSTEIRHRIRDGKPVRRLLHPRVREYIRQNGLYI